MARFLSLPSPSDSPLLSLSLLLEELLLLPLPPPLLPRRLRCLRFFFSALRRFFLSFLLAFLAAAFCGLASRSAAAAPSPLAAGASFSSSLHARQAARIVQPWHCSRHTCTCPS